MLAAKARYDIPAFALIAESLIIGSLGRGGRAIGSSGDAKLTETFTAFHGLRFCLISDGYFASRTTSMA